MTCYSSDNPIGQFFYRLCLEFSVDAVNKLPLAARKAINDMSGGRESNHDMKMKGKSRISSIENHTDYNGNRLYVNLENGVQLMLPSALISRELFDLMDNGTQISGEEILEAHRLVSSLKGPKLDIHVI